MEKHKVLFKKAEKMQREIIELESELYRKQQTAKQNLVNLENEKEKLKNRRPAMLADGKDVSAINKRLKEIDDEIELNNDMVSGTTDKIKSLQSDIHNAQCDTNLTFKDLINCILDKLSDKYVEIGTQFAEIVKEYITLEAIRDSNSNSTTAINWEFKLIPNVKDSENPLFKGSHYGISRENDEFVRRKYGIPDYTISDTNRNF